MFVNLILGPQGAGKDTQAKLLEKHGIAKSFSVGEVLREVALHNKYISRMLKRGDLVDSKTLTDLLIKFFSNKVTYLKETEHIILTGFPREYSQISVLRTLLEYFQWDFGLVIVLDLSLDQIKIRLDNRYVCPVCGAIYNLVTNPPKIPGRCDNDGAKLKKRSDDLDLKAIRHRLQLYRLKTVPVIYFFKKCGCVVSIDASATITKINQELQSIFQHFSSFHTKCKYPRLCK